MADSVPSELLELQARFETWRANRKYVREPIPDQLRGAAREMGIAQFCILRAANRFTDTKNPPVSSRMMI